MLITARVVDAFGTVLSRPWQHPVERVEAGHPLVVDQPALRLDPGYLSGVEEETGAEIVVEVTVAGEPAGGTTHPIRVQAARQWTLDPAAPVLSLELLAAFVQPNHPALPALISEAAQILATATGSGSLAVSHATPERIDEIVGAVFTAVHDREIFYASPPASWGYGQKVRHPGDVLTDRVGTCLDTTLLLASALEHVGITPVLWIAYGHAFLGYWREPERGLPDAASTQIAVPANAVDLELMGVLETTLVTRERRPPRDLVRRARQAPRDAYFLGGAAELLGVVDVGMARMLRVYPLPARRERADGVVEVIEYVPTMPAPAASGTSTGDATGLAGAPAAADADRAGATAGPGVEERSAGPDPAEQAAQPAAADDAGAPAAAVGAPRHAGEPAAGRPDGLGPRRRRPHRRGGQRGRSGRVRTAGRRAARHAGEQGHHLLRARSR